MVSWQQDPLATKDSTLVAAAKGADGGDVQEGPFDGGIAREVVLAEVEVVGRPCSDEEEHMGGGDGAEVVHTDREDLADVNSTHAAALDSPSGLETPGLRNWVGKEGVALPPTHRDEGGGGGEEEEHGEGNEEDFEEKLLHRA